MSEETPFLAGRVPKDQKELVARLGDGNVSAGLRLVVAAGLAAVAGTGEPLLQATDDLARLADRLAGISGRRTPSGAWWAPTDAAMPDPDRLAACGDVVASPRRVVLAGKVGALMIDGQHRRIVAEDPAGQASQDIELGDQAAVAANLAAGLVRLSQTGPGRLVVLPGLGLERLDNGMGRLALRGTGAVADMGTLWRFAAEAVSLTARELDGAIEVRQRLERRLEEAGK